MRIMRARDTCAQCVTLVSLVVCVRITLPAAAGDELRGQTPGFNEAWICADVRRIMPEFHLQQEVTTPRKLQSLFPESAH